jgi:hypothetical protein
MAPVRVTNDSNNAQEVISLPIFHHGKDRLEPTQGPSVLKIAILVVITLWATFVDYLRFVLLGSPRGWCGAALPINYGTVYTLQDEGSLETLALPRPLASLSSKEASNDEESRSQGPYPGLRDKASAGFESI